MHSDQYNIEGVDQMGDILLYVMVMITTQIFILIGDGVEVIMVIMQ